MSREEFSSPSSSYLAQLNNASPLKPRLRQQLESILQEPWVVPYKSGSINLIISQLKHRIQKIQDTFRIIPQGYNPEIITLLKKRLKLYEFMIHELQEYESHRKKHFKNNDFCSLEMQKQTLIEDRDFGIHRLRLIMRDIQHASQNHDREITDLRRDMENQIKRAEENHSLLLDNLYIELQQLEAEYTRYRDNYEKSLHQDVEPEFLADLNNALQKRHEEYEGSRNHLLAEIDNLSGSLQFMMNQIEQAHQEAIYPAAVQQHDIDLESLGAEQAQIEAHLFQLNTRIADLTAQITEKQKYETEKVAPDVNIFLNQQKAKIMENTEALRKQPELAPVVLAPPSPAFALPLPITPIRSGESRKGTPTTAVRVPNSVTPLLPPESKSSSCSHVSGTPEREAKARAASKRALDGQEPDYNIISIPGDGNCGYTAVDITRERAHELLHAAIHNNPVVLELLQPAINELLNEMLDESGFKNFLAVQEVNQEDPIAVAEAYLLYDIEYRNNYVHPAMLQALACVENFRLRIWHLTQERNGTRRLVPHRTGVYDFAEFMPENPTDVIDLLFVNGNHYDRLDINPDYLAQFYPAGEQGRLKRQHRSLLDEFEEADAAAVAQPERSKVLAPASPNIAIAMASTQRVVSSEETPKSPAKVQLSYAASPRLGLFSDPLQHIGNILNNFSSIAILVGIKLDETLKSKIISNQDKNLLKVFAQEQITRLNKLLDHPVFQGEQFGDTHQKIADFRDSLQNAITAQENITIEQLTSLKAVLTITPGAK